MKSLDRTKRACVFASMTLAVSALPASGDYLLAPGDVIEVSVTGASDMRHRAMIGSDGEVGLPLAGSVKVAGLKESQLRPVVQARFTGKPLRRVSADGREVLSMIAPEQVAVAIYEWRPVYVTGDVAKPGQQAFRPGLTARAAVALAGGSGIPLERLGSPASSITELRAQYEALWVEFASQQAQAARLQAEFNGKTSPDLAFLNELPIDPTVVRSITAAVDLEFTARQTAHSKERRSRSQAIEKEAQRIKLLNEQHAHDLTSSLADKEELTRLQDALKRGIAPAPRVTELRRSVASSESRRAQTGVKLVEVDLARDDLSRQLDAFESKRQIDIATEYKMASMQLESTRARLRAMASRMIVTGHLRLPGGERTPPPSISIVRQTASGRQEFTGDEDTELQPGDVLTQSLTAQAPEISTGALAWPK